MIDGKSSMAALHLPTYITQTGLNLVSIVESISEFSSVPLNSRKAQDV